MRFKRHYCDLYGFYLYIVDGTEKEIYKSFKIEADEGFYSFSYTVNSPTLKTYALFNTKNNFELFYIVHEADHCTNDIMHYYGFKADFNNDEAHAYLLGWIVDKIFKFFKLELITYDK